MYLSDGELVVSASDLNNYTACRHLLRLNLEYARRERERPGERDPTAELVARKGDRARGAPTSRRCGPSGREVVEIDAGRARSRRPRRRRSRRCAPAPR